MLRVQVALRPNYSLDPWDVVGHSGVHCGAVDDTASLPEGCDPYQVQSVIPDLERPAGITL